MDNTTLFAHIERLTKVVRSAGQDWARLNGAKAQVEEFLRDFSGAQSSFYLLARNERGQADRVQAGLIATLENYRAYVESGLADAVSPERRAQLDVVSDFLEQAHLLLSTKGVHPAAPIVLIGATLEEFLRTWAETAQLSLGQRKPSMDSYAQILFTEDLITKQDMKDITAWGGLRNSAAHGQWDEVADKARASLMLDGVNLFLRKYS